MTESNRPQRRAIRFTPDPLDFALIMYRADGAPFVAQDVGLILDEAGKGSQLVVKKNAALALGVKLTVQLGKLAPLEATVVWIKDADADIRRIGLEYIEQQ